MNALALREGLMFEFALTPDAIDAAVDGQDRAKKNTLLLALRNMRVNGLLADLRNGEWLKLVSQKLEQAQDPSAKDAVMACLKSLQDRSRIVLHPIQPGEASESAWIDAALASHRRFGLDGVFADEPSATIVRGRPGAEIVVPLAEATDSPRWSLFSCSSVPIKKTEEDYRRVLSTMLAYAKWAIVVDRFQQYGRFTMAAITVISELLGARRARKTTPHATVMLCTAEGGQRPEGRTLDDHYKRGWTVALEPLARRLGINYLVYIEPGAGSIHNRFVFTNQCGIQTGDSQGVYDDDAARADDWARMDEKHVCKRLRECDFRADPLVTRWLEVTANGSRIVDRRAASVTA